jgi:hypothetical protein
MAFPTYEKKEDIPKGFEDLYEEKDGKFSPKVTEIPDVTKLTGALDTERTNAATEKAARVKAENDLAAERRKQAAKEGNISDEQLTKLRDEDAAKRKAELDPVQTELTETKAKLRKITLVDRLRALGTEAGWLPDRAEDALEAALKRADLAEGSDTNIVVKDKDGKVTTEKIVDFLKVTFKKEKPWLYAGSGGSGSGAGGSSRSAGAAEEEPPEPDKKQLDQKRATVAGAL